MKNLKTDSEIISAVIDALGYNNATAFAKELGYKNGSLILNLIAKRDNKTISENLIGRITSRFENVNEVFLRKGEEPILLNNHQAIAQKNMNYVNYTFNDLPILLANLIKEQQNTNELLQQILDNKTSL